MDSTEILKWFRGREDYVAIARGKGFAPYEMKKPPLTAETFSNMHLSQETCLGFYLMTPDNEVYCSCLDFDDHGQDSEWRAKATSYYHFLTEQGLHPLMEVSSSGSGAHLWLHFEEPVPAIQIRSFWKAVGKQVGIPIREIYPRQDALSGEGLGNLVRYPLFGKSRFVDVEDDWKTDTPRVRATDINDLVEIAAKLGKSLPTESPAAMPGDTYVSPRVQEILQWPNSLLERRWNGDTEGLNDTSRSTVCFCLARELVYQRVSSDDIKAAMRFWMKENDYEKSERWISLTLKKAYDIVNKRDGDQHEEEGDMASCALMFIEQLGKHQCMGLGVKTVDQSIDGIGPGEVCIIAARPGHGKSTLALQWLDYQASLGVPTLMLSAEMSQYELGRRMVQRLVGGTEDTWKKNKDKAANKIREYYKRKTKMFVRCITTIGDVEKAISHHVRNHGVQLVAVDYLQLLSGDKSDQGRYHEVTDISRRIKVAARSHNIGVLALCQVSREVDKRDSVQFNLSDMKESGSIEQDADLILAGFYHGRSDKHGGNEEQYELHALKRRNGPIRKTKMEFRFLAEKQLFTDG
tara:strand:+ start:1019 stop:2749 length:1731 start_codon:yes stop_codon:yes gene_type:complete